MSGNEVNEKSIEEFCLPIQGLIRAANRLLADDSSNLYEVGFTFLRRCTNCEAGIDLRVAENKDHKLTIGTVFMHGHCREEIIE